nr:hypothetical protein CFP56_46281 [Quercus suber]
MFFHGYNFLSLSPTFCFIVSDLLRSLSITTLGPASLSDSNHQKNWLPSIGGTVLQGFMMAEPMLMIGGNNAQLKLLHNSCWCCCWRLK